MKRIFILSLIAIVAMAIEGCDFTYDGVAYTVLDENARTCQVKAGTNIGPGAIAQGYKGAITLPANPKDDNGQSYTLISIGENAFYDCRGLTSVSIPNSVTSIGENAFYWCSGLTKAEFTSIESLCKIYFENCHANPLCWAHSLYIDGEEIRDLVIPNSVTSIGENAFYWCSGLTSVTIPDSVTEIRSYAFYGCIGLTSVTIPNSVTEIGDYAFSHCSSLTSVTIPNSVTLIGECAFYGCIGLTSVTIPNSVTSIGWGTFFGCSGLTSVTIPNSVTSIGRYTFNECTGLTSVTIPNSVTSIGLGAFWGCIGLISVTIPNSVTSIGAEAFRNCSSLKSLRIGSSVSSIWRGAWEDCENIEIVECGWTTPVAAPNDIFMPGVYDKATLYVPEGCLDNYLDTKPWSFFYDIKEGGAPTALEGVEAEGGEMPCEIYTLSGVKVDSSRSELEPGVYIIRQGSTVSKIAVR